MVQDMVALMLHMLDKQFLMVFTMATKQMVIVTMDLQTTVILIGQHITVDILVDMTAHTLKALVKSLLHRVLKMVDTTTDVVVQLKLVLVFLLVGIGEECMFRQTTIE
jgi:hypothetical protein